MKNQFITTSEDKFYDYCLSEYKPKTSYINKLKSINLLLKTLKITNAKQESYRFINNIQKSIGVNKTVWGFKKNNKDYNWEFYFYNYSKKNPLITLPQILSGNKEFLSEEFNSKYYYLEKKPYFMFSINVSQKLFDSKKIDGINLYFTSEDRPGGLSYFVNENKFHLENHYAFFQTKTEIQQIINKIKNTIVVDFDKIKLNEILQPEFLKCKTICISNKQQSDCIYFSGIDINQFIVFLKKFNYPKELFQFVTKNKENLDYLQFDVGFDYCMKNGKLEIIKSGFYGIF